MKTQFCAPLKMKCVSLCFASKQRLIIPRFCTPPVITFYSVLHPPPPPWLLAINPFCSRLEDSRVMKFFLSFFLAGLGMKKCISNGVLSELISKTLEYSKVTTLLFHTNYFPFREWWKDLIKTFVQYEYTCHKYVIWEVLAH